MQPNEIDHVRKEDAAYWACALVLAIKHSNKANESSARENLRRLGFELVKASELEKARSMMTELSPLQLSELADAIASRLADRIESQSALLDYSAMAEWLGVSIPHVERLKRQGQIPFVEIGRRVLFDRAAVLVALSQVSRFKTDKTPASSEKCEVVSE